MNNKEIFVVLNNWDFAIFDYSRTEVLQNEASENESIFRLYIWLGWFFFGLFHSGMAICIIRMSVSKNITLLKANILMQDKKIQILCNDAIIILQCWHQLKIYIKVINF